MSASLIGSIMSLLELWMQCRGRVKFEVCVRGGGVELGQRLGIPRFFVGACLSLLLLLSPFSKYF